MEKNVIISIYFAESQTANDFILISCEDPTEKTIRWHAPVLAPYGYWINVDVCGASECGDIEEGRKKIIQALKAQHAETDYYDIAQDFYNGELSTIEDYNDMTIADIENYERNYFEDWQRDFLNFISKSAVTIDA
jgi:hypothetical protein